MNLSKYFTFILSLIISTAVFGQLKTIKFTPTDGIITPNKINVDLRTSELPTKNNIDYLGFKMDDLSLIKLEPKVLHRDKNGQAIAISYRRNNPINNRSRSNEDIAIDYINDLSGILHLSPVTDQFSLISTVTDEYGITHTKMGQQYKGLNVYGYEIMIHGDHNGYNYLNGHSIHIDEQLSITPHIEMNMVDKTIQLGLSSNILFKQIPISLEKIIKTPHSTPELSIYIDKNKVQKLAWIQTIHANALETYEVILDAKDGHIIDYWTTTCQLHNHYQAENEDNKKAINRTAIPLNITLEEKIVDHMSELDPQGDESASGRDLNGRNQQFNVWKDGSNFYMIDASQSIYSRNNSKMPDEPVGALWTLDGFNTSPANQSFKVDHVKSGSSSWNALSVSAHSNALKAFKYYQQTHKRKSINGKGGNVISFIRVADENGRNMDNAFWNGQAIFYGSGNTQFKQLAGGLDVAGHEMTHGVIQNSANLIYKNEPGAINESMADVFGVMIDRNDWFLGEDIVIKSAFPSGAMRDMSNPHNGGNRLGDPGFQPSHTREQYKGSQDNGGVHINSGIPNHAFYLFVKEMAKGSSEAQAKSKAEKIYYQALTNYLGRSSQFIDLRIAVVKSANDIHGSNSSEGKAAEKAFSDVGIGKSSGGGGTTNYQDDLPTNPGSVFFLATDLNHNRIDLYDIANSGNNRNLSTSGLINRPSVTDDGSAIVFVAKDNKIHALIQNSNGQYEESIIQNEAIWRNVAIAKDGSRIAAIRSEESPTIDVFDFSKNEWKTFELYNPTYTQGVSTGDVLYADAIEFEHSGQFITYDAASRIRSNSGSDYEYWDIGFVEVWNKGTNNWTKGEINKLFSGLPENVSIGNPTFAKNSPYILAFDLIEDDFTGIKNQLWGANIETGKTNQLFESSELTYPNYAINDRNISFNGINNGNKLIGQLPLQPDKISGGQASVILQAGQWGVWFANGTRKLDVATNNIEDAEGKFTVLSNPIQNSLVLIIGYELNNDSPIFEIVDQNGTIQGTYKYNHIKSTQKIEIKTSQLAPGSYSIILNDTGKRSQRRFIKL